MKKKRSKRKSKNPYANWGTGFKGVKIKPVKIKPIKITALDSDRDMVPNFFDCKPYNPRKQHLAKRKKKALKKMQIGMVTPYGAQETFGMKPAYQKLIKKEKHPKQKEYYKERVKEKQKYEQKLSSMFAKNPAAYESVRRMRERDFSVTFHGGQEIGRHSKHLRGVASYAEHEPTPEEQFAMEMREPESEPEEEFYDDEYYEEQRDLEVDIRSKGYKRTKAGEETTIHEEVHTKQYEEEGAEGMSDSSFYHSYREDPHEIEARKVSKRKMRDLFKRKKPTEEEIAEGLDTTMDV